MQRILAYDWIHHRSAFLIFPNPINCIFIATLGFNCKKDTTQGAWIQMSSSGEQVDSFIDPLVTTDERYSEARTMSVCMFTCGSKSSSNVAELSVAFCGADKLLVDPGNRSAQLMPIALRPGKRLRDSSARTTRRGSLHCKHNPSGRNPCWCICITVLWERTPVRTEPNLHYNPSGFRSKPLLAHSTVKRR